MAYRDIDLKTLSDLLDSNAIKQSVKNIVMIETGDLLGMPEFGTKTKTMLFEQMTVFEISTLRTSIEASLYRYEPRITNIEVDIAMTKEEYSLTCTITYTVKQFDRQEQVSLKI